jgi:hypothetical protein
MTRRSKMAQNHVRNEKKPRDLFADFDFAIPKPEPAELKRTSKESLDQEESESFPESGRIKSGSISSPQDHFLPSEHNEVNVEIIRVFDIEPEEMAN